MTLVFVPFTFFLFVRQPLRYQWGCSLLCVYTCTAPASVSVNKKQCETRQSRGAVTKNNVNQSSDRGDAPSSCLNPCDSVNGELSQQLFETTLFHPPSSSALCCAPHFCATIGTVTLTTRFCVCRVFCFSFLNCYSVSVEYFHNSEVVFEIHLFLFNLLDLTFKERTR